ncbi:unnamed protein product, partial [Sphacelaria rigidula]
LRQDRVQVQNKHPRQPFAVLHLPGGHQAGCVVRGSPQRQRGKNSHCGQTSLRQHTPKLGRLLGAQSPIGQTRENGVQVNRKGVSGRKLRRGFLYTLQRGNRRGTVRDFHVPTRS